LCFVPYFLRLWWGQVDEGPYIALSVGCKVRNCDFPPHRRATVLATPSRPSCAGTRRPTFSSILWPFSFLRALALFFSLDRPTLPPNIPQASHQWCVILAHCRLAQSRNPPRPALSPEARLRILRLTSTCTPQSPSIPCRFAARRLGGE
jgi:hypothetical protein